MIARYLLCTLLGICGSTPLIGQLPSRTIAATAVTTISADRLDVADMVGAAVTATGELAVGDPQDLVVVIVTPEGAVRRMGRSGEGPGEFRNIREVAFHDGMLWVDDNRLMRLTGFTADGRVGKVHKFTVFGALPDGSKLVVWPVAFRGPDTVLFHAAVTSSTREGLPVGSNGLIRQSLDGRNTDELGWVVGRNPCLESLSGGPRFTRPFCAEPVLAAAPNGAGTLIVTELPEDPELSSFLVSVHSAATGSDAAVRISYRGQPLTQAVWDSVTTAATTLRTRVPQLGQALENLPRPRHYPAFGKAVLLDDLTALVQVFPEDAATNRWVVIREGRAVGQLELAVRERPLAGTGGALWVSTRDADGLIGLRLYRLAD